VEDLGGYVDIPKLTEFAACRVPGWWLWVRMRIF
jgi:hypothetical protein